MRILTAFVFVLMLSNAYASLESLGPDGINSLGLQLPSGNPLTGNGFSIGQIEVERPGKPVYDNTSNSNAFIDPAAVFVFDHGPLANFDIKEPGILGHAQSVASVMISTDEDYPGVAPGASLYASAFRTPADPTYSDYYDAILVTAQHIARQDNELFNEVAAINHSYVVTLGTAAGNSQLTLGLDWLSRVDNVLNITGMPNQRTVTDPFWYHPFDDFNGITVARSTKVGPAYTRVASQTEFVTAVDQNRTFIDIIAPGDDINIRQFGETPVNRSGNSYAVPHVTGTVALLQEYGEARAVPPDLSHWVNRERHEVLKAVLLNSADKIKDDGTTVYNGQPVPVGGFLGMERTLLDTSGNNWLSSEAMTDDYLPLDDQMGAGHLNAKRAIQQFGGAEWSHDTTPVPLIGWDYGQTADQEDINKYVFAEELLGKSFISITLAWDRTVEFDDDNGSPGTFTSGAIFQTVEFPPDAFRRLDLYLMPAGATDISQAITQSLSEDSNLGHIFFQIPETGDYEIWVSQFDDLGFTQNYGIAWWAAGVVEQVSGDFDNDGDVDGRDFLVWQRNPSIGNLSDWQTNYGMGSLSAVSVPEPSCLALLLLALVGRRGWARESSITG